MLYTIERYYNIIIYGRRIQRVVPKMILITFFFALIVYLCTPLRVQVTTRKLLLLSSKNTIHAASTLTRFTKLYMQYIIIQYIHIYNIYNFITCSTHWNLYTIESHTSVCVCVCAAQKSEVNGHKRIVVNIVPDTELNRVCLA